MWFPRLSASASARAVDVHPAAPAMPVKLPGRRTHKITRSGSPQFPPKKNLEAGF